MTDLVVNTQKKIIWERPVDYDVNSYLKGYSEQPFTYPALDPIRVYVSALDRSANGGRRLIGFRVDLGYGYRTAAAISQGGSLGFRSEDFITRLNGENYSEASAEIVEGFERAYQSNTLPFAHGTALAALYTWQEPHFGADPIERVNAGGVQPLLPDWVARWSADAVTVVGPELVQVEHAGPQYKWTITPSATVIANAHLSADLADSQFSSSGEFSMKCLVARVTAFYLVPITGGGNRAAGKTPRLAAGRSQIAFDAPRLG